MPEKTVPQSGGIIVYGEHVVLRRNKRGKWIFPKGHIDRGETAAQTAARESEEETGLRVEVIDAIGSIRFKAKDEKFEVEYFILRAVSEGPRWQMHLNSDTFLVPPEQVAAHLSFSSLKELWEQVHERILSLTSPARS